MFKKTAVTAILLALFLAASLIADNPPGERFPVDIYVTVHVNGEANVDVGYFDANHNTPYMVNHYYKVHNDDVIHYHKDVWPPNDPPPYYGFAEGWGTLYGGYDYDEGIFGYPLYLELWIGMASPDPQDPEE